VTAKARHPEVPRVHDAANVRKAVERGAAKARHPEVPRVHDAANVRKAVERGAAKDGFAAKNQLYLIPLLFK
jgi:hypothetical protein